MSRAQIIPLDPPVATVVHPARRRSDDQILAEMEEPSRPSDIARRVGMSTHAVATRLRVLADRGQVRRIRLPGAPANGPGASLYQRV